MPDNSAHESPLPEGDQAMPLMDHVRELRRRFFYIFLGLAVATAALMPLMRPLFDLA